MSTVGTASRSSLSKPVAIVLSLGLVGVIGVVDYVTGFMIVFSAFYLLPVGVAAWYVGSVAGILISVLSVGVWLAGDFAAGVKYPSMLVPIWNGAIGLIVYFVVVGTLTNLRKLQRELE